MRAIALEQPLADLLAEREALEEQIRALPENGESEDRERLEAEVQRLSDEYDTLQRDIFASLTPLDKVQLARHPDRPPAGRPP